MLNLNRLLFDEMSSWDQLGEIPSNYQESQSSGCHPRKSGCSCHIHGPMGLKTIPSSVTLGPQDSTESESSPLKPALERPDGADSAVDNACSAERF